MTQPEYTPTPFNAADHMEHLEQMRQLIAAREKMRAAAAEDLAALKRETEHMACILNHVTLPGAYYEKLSRELEANRYAIAKAEGRS